MIVHRLVILVLCACNQFYGLEETTAVGDDRDGDSIGDLDDNCPDLANTDQHNEDLDAFGDLCDKCPAAVDDGEDRDGDGVGDLCDPRPTADGDCLVLFDTFDGTAAAFAQNWTLAMGDAPTLKAGTLRILGPETTILLANGFSQSVVELGGFAVPNGNAPVFGTAQGVTATSGVACVWMVADGARPAQVVSLPAGTTVDSASFFPELDTKTSPPSRIQWVGEAPNFRCSVRVVYYVALVEGSLPAQQGLVGIVSTLADSIVEYFAVYARDAACTPTVFR